MSLIILSPHRDDAAFSCGIIMRLAVDAGVPVRTVNVFTRSGYAPFADSPRSEAVSELRLQEDMRVASLLENKLELDDLDWADAPVRRDIVPEQTFDQPLDALLFQQEANALAVDLEPRLSRAACVLLPLANQHLDHKIARAAVERHVPPERLAYYEDLPYFARLSPADRACTLRSLVPSSVEHLPIVHPAGAAVKRRLAACYPSQVDAATVEEIGRYAMQLAQQTHPAAAHSKPEVGAEILYAGSKAKAVLQSVLARVESL